MEKGCQCLEGFNNIEELATYYGVELAKLVDNFSPIKHKLRTIRFKAEWMDDSLTQLKHKIMNTREYTEGQKHLRTKKSTEN